MSVPGIGPLTALRFVAAIDDVQPFSNAHSVAVYLGLTPGEHSSSQRKHRTGITKAGCAPVRRVLVLAAWQFKRSRPLDPIAQWAKGIEERRGKLVATVALARKLSAVLYAIWRDGSRYEPAHQLRRQHGQ
jgi:transposase